MTATTDTPISVADPAVIKCPYPAYAKLREEAPVYLDPVTQFWILTRYDDVRNALLSPDVYLSDYWTKAISSEVQVAREKRAHERFIHEGLGVPGPSIGQLPLDLHAPVRAVFNNAFRASRIRGHQDFIRDTAYRYAERFAAKGSGDLVKEFTLPFPMEIISRLAGIPQEDVDRVNVWAASWLARFGGMLDDEGDQRAVTHEIEFQHYMKELIDRLRAHPDDSILSDIVNIPTPDGQYLDDTQLFTHIQADLIVAGSETTGNAMSAGMLLLASNPELSERVRSEPETYLRVFVEEVLRLESPAQGLFRVAGRDIELHGVTIPKGALIQLRYGAANRDQDAFADADALDLDRESLDHLAFSGGVHGCAGAPLARAELYWAFKALLDTLDNIEVLAENDFEYLPSTVHRGLLSLKLGFTKKANESAVEGA